MSQISDIIDRGTDDIIEGISSLITGVLSIPFLMVANVPGLGDLLAQTARNAMPFVLPTPDQVVFLRRRGNITQEEADKLLKYQGFDKKQAKHIFETTEARPNVPEIVTLYWRYKDFPDNPFGINRTWFEASMGELGYRPEDVDKILEANRPVPTVQDILLFMDRDVYNSNTKELLKLLDGLENQGQYQIEAEKRGLSRTDSENYYAAHWQTVGIQTAFEMFHRLRPDANTVSKFTEKDMDAYFDVAEIVPGLRDRLKEISYNVPVRVDFRRMWRSGTLHRLFNDPRNALKGFYLDLGYSPFFAEIMTEWTIDYEDPNRDLSRSQILDLYRNKGLGNGDENRSQAQTLLLDLHYPEREVEWMLDLEDIKIAEREEERDIARIKRQFIHGTISDTAELRKKVLAVVDTKDEAEEVIQNLIDEREASQKRMSNAQAEKLARLGTISNDEYISILVFNGMIREDAIKVAELLTVSDTAPEQQPSKADILSWLKKDIIKVPEAKTLLSSLGFERRFINYYIQSIGLDEKILER